VAVQVADLDEAQVARLLLELDGEVGLGAVAAVGPAAVDRHRAAAAHLHELGAAVAVEIPFELRDVADLQVVQVQVELAREVDSAHRLEAPRRLAPEVEIEADADPLDGHDLDRLE